MGTGVDLSQSWICAKQSRTPEQKKKKNRFCEYFCLQLKHSLIFFHSPLTFSYLINDLALEELKLCFGLMDCVQMSKHPKHVPYLYLAQPDNTAYFVATDSGVDKLGEMQCIYNRMFSHLFQGNVAPCSLNSQLK